MPMPGPDGSSTTVCTVSPIANLNGTPYYFVSMAGANGFTTNVMESCPPFTGSHTGSGTGALGF